MEKKRDSRLTVDLLDYKKPWVDFCKAQGVSPSDALRQVVARLIEHGAAQPTHQVQMVAGEEERPTLRKKVSMTPSEFAAVEALAKSEGFSAPKWIVALIRGRLTGQPQFGQPELEALTSSNLQLMKIGRNLNQLAKALNTAPHERGAFRVDLIEQIDSAIKVHTGKVAGLVSASTRRWVLK